MAIGVSTARSGRTSSGATEFQRMECPQVVDPSEMSRSCIRWPTGRRAPRIWHGGCFKSPVWDQSMSFRPFTSESYSEGDRLEAWRAVLSAVGLQPAAGSPVHTGHATASRRNAEGVVLARLAAGSQAVSAVPHLAGEMPMMLFRS